MKFVVETCKKVSVEIHQQYWNNLYYRRHTWRWLEFPSMQFCPEVGRNTCVSWLFVSLYSSQSICIAMDTLKKKKVMQVCFQGHDSEKAEKWLIHMWLMKCTSFFNTWIIFICLFEKPLEPISSQSLSQ